MTGTKANNTALARIANACGILKSRKSLSRELLRQRTEDKKKEDRHYIRKG